MLQELGGATVIGPLIVGLDKPVQIVPLGAKDSDIVNMAALASFQHRRVSRRRRHRAAGRHLNSWTRPPASTTRSEGYGEEVRARSPPVLATRDEELVLPVGMPEFAAVFSVRRPRKNDVVMMSNFTPALRSATSAAGTRGLSMIAEVQRHRGEVVGDSVSIS